jgi:CheY-like chemotaxis protein
VVDDEADIVATFSHALEYHSFSVTGFTDPNRALSDFKLGFYDMIILDVRMPRLNGFELARALWQIDGKAPICLMTAFEIYEDEAKKIFKDFKTHCFLKKPMTTKALIEHIEKHLLKA